MHGMFKIIENRILELFIEESNSQLSLREIARKLNVSLATIIKHINKLVKKEFNKISGKNSGKIFKGNNQRNEDG